MDMKKKINNKGFTLIELLAVIAITAIVLGIGTYGIVNLVKKSNKSVSKISLTSIKETANIYSDEASDSLWIDPGSGNYKYYCITIEELINKGIIKKNAKLPKGIDKSNYVSVKKNKVTLVKNDPVILDTNADINSTDYQVCTGNKFEEKVSKIPEFTGNKSWTDSLEVSFNDGKAESDIKDKWCQYDTTSSISGDKNIIVLDSKTNTCNIDKNLTNKTSYYVRICMSTVNGSTMCSDTNSYSTADFINPEFSTKDDTITIKYKDDNVKEPYHYFKSNVNGNSDKNVSECVLGSDNKFTCSGSTSNITKDKWYKVNEKEVKITYKDNEIKNGDITARIMDGTGNYKDGDKKFNLYRIVFKKGNADKINNSTNDITNICLNDIDKKCNIKSPSISKDGYTIVGWNTDSSASSSIWKANTSKDIDGSNTYYPIIKSRVNIKLNANGGSVTKETSKGGTYTTDSSGIISRNGKDIFHKINYGDKMNSSGLANYNNKDYLYITKNGSIVTKNKEWICLSGCTTNGKVYSQYEAYSSDDFCDAKEKSCTVVLGVNWKNENYTLTYDNNGGSGCTSKSMNYGDEYGTLCTPSKRGYAFVGWFDNNYKNSPLNYYADTYSDLKNAFGYDANRLYKHYFEYGLKEGRRISQYISSDIYNTEGNKTIYAGWKGVVYKINYNANGGTGTMESNNAEFGTNVTIKNNGFTRDGYTFAGWTTKSNGTDDGYGWTGWSGTWNYADGQYGIAENKLVLYARWKKNKVYIKLDANGGSVRGSTTYGSCRTNNNLIGCSWNSPKELFHTIDYGDSLDSAGLANYNNSDYLYITKDGYFAYASEAWICDSSSGCSTVGKTFDQDKAYKASEFCDASGGDCTVTLKVNWKKIDTTINDWRCHDKYSYFITYCDSDDTCEYTARAYKENGASYSERVYGKINRNNLNLSSCFVDNIDDYRCNSNGKYKITTCSVTTCIYTELNGNTMNPNNLYIVDRDTLKECVPDTKTMYVISSNGVNCRYGAGTSYGIAVAYSCGAALTVNVNATNGWYYVTNDGCYSVGSALSSSKPSSCVGSSGGGTSGGCKKIVKCITSAGSDAQCRSKISSLGGSYAGYNGKGDCIGNFCRSSCPSGSVETGGFY